jgi:hypothetical protein
MNQRIPESVRPALQEFVSCLNERIPGLTKGLYVEGSIALGGFNENFSDIDFVALLSRRTSAAEFTTLCDIHKAIGREYPRWKISGSYLQPDDRGGSESKVDAIICYEGKLTPNGKFDWNWVDGWTVKNHGISVIGPEAQTLPVNVDWNRLILTMRENLNSYWVGWTTRPYCLGAMMLDRGIQWAVLGVLRQFYTFRENTITTKVKAGEYALTCLPSRWHPLIREAIEIREGKQGTIYSPRLVRMTEAVMFLRFVIQTCNDTFAE